MDHIIGELQVSLEIYLDMLKEDWSSGQYAKLPECPIYDDAKALRNAIIILEKHYYGEIRTLPIKQLISL